MKKQLSQRDILQRLSTGQRPVPTHSRKICREASDNDQLIHYAIIEDLAYLEKKASITGTIFGFFTNALGLMGALSPIIAGLLIVKPELMIKGVDLIGGKGKGISSLKELSSLLRELSTRWKGVQSNQPVQKEKTESTSVEDNTEVPQKEKPKEESKKEKETAPKAAVIPSTSKPLDWLPSVAQVKFVPEKNSWQFRLPKDMPEWKGKGKKTAPEVAPGEIQYGEWKNLSEKQTSQFIAKYPQQHELKIQEQKVWKTLNDQVNELIDHQNKITDDAAKKDIEDKITEFSNKLLPVEQKLKAPVPVDKLTPGEPSVASLLVLDKLIRLADTLDRKGLVKEANEIDNLIREAGLWDKFTGGLAAIKDKMLGFANVLQPLIDTIKKILTELDKKYFGDEGVVGTLFTKFPQLSNYAEKLADKIDEFVAKLEAVPEPSKTEQPAGVELEIVPKDVPKPKIVRTPRPKGRTVPVPA